jgi:aspartate aminotransferase
VSVAARIAALSPSPTMAVDAKAKALRAAGEPVIAFAAGEPDFATPAHVVEAARAAAADPAMHRYTPAAGLPDLREAVAARARRDGLDVAASQVVVTNGGKHALYNTFMALVDPGDEVLVPAPYWVSYPEQIRLAGGVPVVVPTDPDDGYRVTVDRLEAARTPRTKVLVHVSPSNPTGAVLDPATIAEIGRWAHAHGIWVVSDDIYRELVYGDATFASLPALVPEHADRTVIVDGVAKAYAMTGWRVGWSIAPPEVAAGITTLQTQLCSNVSNVAQAAALAALTGPQDEVAAMRTAFDRRRRTMVGLLRAIEGVELVEPEGAFYAFPSVRGVLERPIAGRRLTSSLELADLLLDEARVAVVPGEAFGAAAALRLSYALSDADLEEGVDRIAATLAG